MDTKFKQIYQNILNHKLPEENIPQFFNHMVNEYHTFSTVKLAMHYYSFYEAYCDEGQSWSEASRDSLDKLNHLIHDSILQMQYGSDLENAVRLADHLRNDVIKRMKALISYTDVFQNYEYILNRVEYRFKDEIEMEDNEEFAREVLNYIFDTDDNIIINDKIREMIGQLPIRITKQKYYDLIKSSLREYIGASEDTLDTFLYMLRTSSMLALNEDMKNLYPELWEQKEFLEHLDYKNINKDIYDDAEKILKKSAHILAAETFVYYSIQEIINEVYASLLCIPYSGIEANRMEQAVQAANSIIDSINGEFIKNSKIEPPEELIQYFSFIEGVQEEIGYDLTAMEEALFQIDQEYRSLTESIMADKLLNALLLCRDLLSNSIFIDFYEIKLTNTVEEDRILLETDHLIKELSEFFDQHDRMICRAVIANTMNKIPVFFQNHKEVMDYILYSLEKCTDVYEKSASIDIIRGIMNV